MKTKIVIILILAFILTGCWSEKELNQITLITSMAIDKEDDEYIMSLSIIVPSEAMLNAPGRSSPSVLLSSRGISPCDAFRNITSKISRIPNLSHVQNIIISEEIAKEGIATVIDSLLRDDQIRPTVFLFIAKGVPAKDILKINTSIESSVSIKINQLIKNAETNHSKVHSVNLVSFINHLVSDTKEAYLPGLEVIGDIEKGNTKENSQNIEPEADVQLTPYAIFKKDKMIGWIDKNTSKGANLLLNKVKDTMIDTIVENEDNYSLEIVNAKTKIKYKNNKFEINTKLTGKICQACCTAELHDPKNIDKIEAKFAKAVKQQLEDTIKTLQNDYNSDIIGFADYIYRKDPKYWKKISKDWDKLFPTMKYSIKVEVNIFQPGSSVDPLKKGIK